MRIDMTLDYSHLITVRTRAIAELYSVDGHSLDMLSHLMSALGVAAGITMEEDSVYADNP